MALEALQSQLNTVLQSVVIEAVSNLIKQGHQDSGKLAQTVKAEVERQANSIVGQISFEQYGVFQDTGIKPGRIPYSQGSGAGRSKYITALTAWVKRKGIEGDQKKAKGIAFAIAKTHKKVGMHSKNGRAAPEQAKWLSGAVDKFDAQIEQAVGNAMEKELGFIFDRLIAA